MQPLPSLLRSVLGFMAPLKIQGLNLSDILKKVSICGLRTLTGAGPCILFRRERVTPRWCGSRGRKTLKWCGHKPRSPIYHQKQGMGPFRRPAQEQILSKIDAEFLSPKLQMDAFLFPHFSGLCSFVTILRNQLQEAHQVPPNPFSSWGFQQSGS